jgi:hypothetical protein
VHAHQQEALPGGQRHRIAITKVEKQPGAFTFKVKRSFQDAEGKWQPGGSGGGTAVLNEESLYESEESVTCSIGTNEVEVIVTNTLLRCTLRRLESGEYVLDAECQAWSPNNGEGDKVQVNGRINRVVKAINLDVPVEIQVDATDEHGQPLLFELSYSKRER